MNKLKVKNHLLIYATLALTILTFAALYVVLKPLIAKHVIWILLLALCSAVAIFYKKLIRPEWLGVVALTSITVLLALYSAELLVYFQDRAGAKSNVVYSEKHDRRTIREVVKDIRKAGDVGAVPIVYPSYITRNSDVIEEGVEIDGHTVLPLSAISDRTTVLCNESGSWAIYQSDEHGFNNPKGLWQNPVDIAVIGDSFSHGNCVRSGQDWVSLLRKEFPRTLTLSMGGNGPLFELATIKEYLPAIRPKVVVWGYFEANDWRIPAEEALPILQRYLTETNFMQGLEAKRKKIDIALDGVVQRQLNKQIEVPLSNKQEKDDSIHILDRLFLGSLRSKLRSSSTSEEQKKINATFRKIIVEAKRVVNSWGGKLYFVYLPAFSGLTSDKRPGYYSREDLAKFMEKEDIPVIDLYPAFKSKPDPKSYFPYRGPFHYNEEGYKLVSEAVALRLTRDQSQNRLIKTSQNIEP